MLRRAEAAGAYVSVGRRGAEAAGAVFVAVDRRDGRVDLYGPAPQTVFEAGAAADRRFSLIAEALAEREISARMEREIRFDPDLWLVEIEDRSGRSFLELA